MPKIKMSRKSISLDMTAMCDMAFLLLTFFMLSTQFKADQAEVVDIPTSISEIKLPEKDLLIITVEKGGQVFLGTENQHIKRAMVEKVVQFYHLPLSEDEKRKFSLLASYGSPVDQLKSFLGLNELKRKAVQQSGIPIDSANNELKIWVKSARVANPHLKIAIRGDRDSDYKVVKNVIAILQEQKINKFNLITNLEQRPQGSQQ